MNDAVKKLFAQYEKAFNALDVTYFIQKFGPEPRIIMFIAHQDEERAMKELGFLG